VLSRPPYAINNAGWRAPLETKTMPPSCTHANGWRQVRIGIDVGSLLSKNMSMYVCVFPNQHPVTGGTKGT
jgi:hypothetical protein